jgi:hypothetical protein
MVGPFMAVEEGSSAQAYLQNVENFKLEVQTFQEAQEEVAMYFGKGLTIEHHLPNSWLRHVDWVNPFSLTSSAAQLGSLTAMPTVPQIPPDLQADLETMSKIYAEGEN